MQTYPEAEEVLRDLLVKESERSSDNANEERFSEGREEEAEGGSSDFVSNETENEVVDLKINGEGKLQYDNNLLVFVVYCF